MAAEPGHASDTYKGLSKKNCTLHKSRSKSFEIKSRKLKKKKVTHRDDPPILNIIARYIMIFFSFNFADFNDKLKYN